MEALLVLPVALLSAMFLIEISLAVFRYAILVHSVSHVARQIAVDTEGAADKDQLIAAAPTRAINYIVSTFNFDQHDFAFAADTFVDAQSRCHLVLRGEMRFSCVMCRFFNSTVPLKTESQGLIEDECFKGAC